MQITLATSSLHVTIFRFLLGWLAPLVADPLDSNCPTLQTHPHAKAPIYNNC